MFKYVNLYEIIVFICFTIWLFLEDRMKEIKLIATDIDNTLLNSKKEITPRAKRALQLAVGKGIHVCLVSGRPVTALAYLQEQLGIPVSYGSLNGAISIFNDVIISAHSISYEQVKTVIMLLRKYHCVINLYSQDNWYTEPEDWTYDMESKMLHRKGIIIENLLNFVDCCDEKILPFYKMVVVHKDDEIICKIEEELKTLNLGLNVYQSAPNFIEINHGGVDKGIAITEISSYWNIPIEQVFAIGDYFNDVSMLEKAGVSVAMLNAPDVIKKIATSVSSEDMDHEGFAIEIEKILERCK